MSSTSKKHKHFVSEPMGEKPVTELAGIGEVLGGRLARRGFGKADAVFGQFLLMGRDEQKFGRWLKDISGANSKHRRDCHGCLQEWSLNNL
ncbi:barrier-to-autointegration factor-like [Genypterus blacodes]|uniref:barrier-to-autointegration factor-like n=1 Tax=Genypterus blacodes TaxID=154954 RepID=UPI003F77805B